TSVNSDFALFFSVSPCLRGEHSFEALNPKTPLRQPNPQPPQRSPVLPFCFTQRLGASAVNVPIPAHHCVIIGSAMRILILTALLALPALAAEPAKSPVVPDNIPDRFTSAAFGRQHIDGILGDRMRVNLEGRLLHVDE